MTQTKHMLTTVDNPFDPTTQFDEWYQYDVRKGYHSLSLLSRMTMIADDLSDADKTYIIEEAIQTIVQENLSGVHTRVPMTIK